jgi:hypothetical protein
VQDQHAQGSKGQGAQQIANARRPDQEGRPHDAQPGGRGGGEQAELGVHKCGVALGLTEKQHVKAQRKNEGPIQGEQEPFHHPTPPEET